jgi:hypothetical protein
LVPSEDIRIGERNLYKKVEAKIKPSLQRNKTTLNLNADINSLQKTNPELINIGYDEFSHKEADR